MCIDELFIKQKKGIIAVSSIYTTAVLPGFINYGYKNGKTAGHTKSAFSFTNYKILTFTIDGIITLNTLIYINKIRSHSLALPNCL